MTEREQQAVKRETTSIKIDPNLWKEAKIEAIRRDIEVSEFVEQAIRRELGTGNRLHGQGKLGKGNKI